jgi:NAD(P)H-flavin reductase
MLLTLVGILGSPSLYIAGPPTMVAATRRMLDEVGVDEDDIRTEESAGIENHRSMSGADDWPCCLSFR